MSAQARQEPSNPPATDAPTDGPTDGRGRTGSYYTPLEEGTYLPSAHAQGVWREDEQHMGPVSGLLTHALTRHEPRPDLQLARISFDILGMIPAVPSQVRTRTLRPGRTIELIEATLSAGGRDVVRATAWRLARQDTAAVAGGGGEPLPGPEGLAPWDAVSLWGGGYIASLEIRSVDPPQPGHARAWIRARPALVEGVEVDVLARFLTVVDTANGIATRVDMTRWAFPNTDLTVHLFREPVGEWAGFDTEVAFGPSGVGLTSTRLYDEAGPVGRAEQILTLRPRTSHASDPTDAAEGSSR